MSRRVHSLASAPLITDIGEFTEHYFTDGAGFFAALTLNTPFNSDPIPVRIHSDCISAHVFNGCGCNCREQMRASQEFIVTYGCGLIVWLPQDGRGNGHAAKLMAEKFKKLGFEQGAAYVQCGFKGDARDYDAAVGIVEHFAIQSVIILSENEAKLNALRSHGVKIHASHSVG